MRNPVFAVLPVKVLCQGAFVALLAGASAACSGSVERFNQPLFTGSTDNQRAIIGGADQPMPAPVASAAPSRAVARADLPPPQTQMASLEPAAMPPAPAEQRISGPWKWSAAGGQAITVRPGDSLDILAIRYGVPSNEIARANGISSPAQLSPGKVIVIPVKVADMGGPSDEPVRPRMAAANPPAAAEDGSSHVVQPGETLYSIARQHGVKVGDLASANRLPSFDAIRTGQRLVIPSGKVAPPPKVAAVDNTATGYGGTRIIGTVPADQAKTAASARAPATQTASLDPAPAREPAKAPAIAPQPTTPVSKGASQTTTDAAVAIQEASDPPSANGTSFRWPVRGRIISGFGAKPGGDKNDGINLAVPEGTSVKAAEAGTVIYAGNELSGYGNLVLIRHADGWVSAYAHNSALKVKKGDQVTRGETIATAGATGSVTSPQVHFELRKGAKPVNPLDYLASG